MKEYKGAVMRRIVIITILIMIALGVLHHLFFSNVTLVSLFKKEAPQEQTETPQQQAPGTQAIPIKAFVVSQFDFKDYLDALGTVKGGLEFKLSFEIPGIIETVNYNVGEKYDKGALLMSLRQDDILLRLRRSEAKFKKAVTGEDIYKNKLEEHEKLFSIGAIPESTLEKARLEYQGAQYEREEAELQVRSDEIILEKSNLYSPSAGMIGELNVEVGEAVTSNTLVGTHLLTEYVKVEFGVIERDVSRIAIGQSALIFVDAYPDRIFNGTVDKISPIVTGTSRTATAEVKIDNTEGLLLPGMFARIKILLFEKSNAIVIPSEAVIDIANTKSVYVIDTQKNTAHMRTIQVEYMQSDYAVITEGLKKNELVAISGLDKLKPDCAVEVLEKQEI